MDNGTSPQKSDPASPEINPAQKTPSATAARSIRTMQRDIAELQGTPVPDMSPSAPTPAPTPVPQQQTSEQEPIMFRSADQPDPTALHEFNESTPTISDPERLAEVTQPKPVNPFIDPEDTMTAAEKREREEQKPKVPLVSPIHTYTSDVAEAIKTSNTSLAKIAIAEQQGREVPQLQDDTERKALIKNIIVITLSVIFMAGGAAAVLYFVLPKEKEEPKVITEYVDILQAEKNSEIPFEGTTRDTLTRAVQKETSGEVTFSTITHVYLTIGTDNSRRLATTEEFLTKLETRAPAALVRTLDPEFYIGAYGSSGGTQPFIIFKVQSYDTAYAGMLEWEKSLIRDLQDIFFKKEDRVLPPYFSNTATGKKHTFVDAISQNRDVRIVKNEQNQVIMLYSFVDQNTLILTTNEFVLKELVSRMVKAKYIR